MSAPIDRLTAALEPLPFPHETQRTTVRTDDLALVLAVVEAAPGVLREADRNTDAFNALRAAIAAIEGSKP